MLLTFLLLLNLSACTDLYAPVNRATITRVTAVVDA